MTTENPRRPAKPGSAPQSPGGGGLVLLTGVSGYIGGRLHHALAAHGVPLRNLARDPARVAARLSPGAEIVQGDVLKPETLDAALAGVESAYYLVHSMGERGDFAAKEQEGALNFGRAAARAGVRRIIYLGGIGDESAGLSAHLRSRMEVARALAVGGVPVMEFRASIVVGSGSFSFEMIRALVERLPVMVTPRWVRIEAQPIAVDDVLAYLIQALDVEASGPRVWEIGGRDRVSYGGLMQMYAEVRGVRRLMIPVPALSPWLSSLWLGLVTPLFARVGRHLIESIRHATVVRSDAAARDFPTIVPMGAREAMKRALALESGEATPSRWSDASALAGGYRDWAAVRLGRRLTDHRTLEVDLPPHAAFRPIREIGGANGWYYAGWLWKLRAALDLLLGGVGMRRGRSMRGVLRVGDAIDCWRVEAYEPDRRLRLAAEMKLPGRAWLQFDVLPTATGSQIVQTALFDPSGWVGRLYWYVVYPLHLLVFRGMLRAIAARGMRLAQQETSGALASTPR